MASVEPVAAVLIAVLFLDVAFTREGFLGFLPIFSTIPIIAIGQHKEATFSQRKVENLIHEQESSSLS